MNYKVRHTTKYAYSEAVPVCHNLVHLAPRTLPRQTCDEFRLLVHPAPLDVSHRQDYFGNNVTCFSIDQPHRGLAVTATSRVNVSPSQRPTARETPPWDDLAAQLRTGRTAESLDAYQFVVESPSIKPFAALSEFTKPSFPSRRPILEAVLHLTARIHDDFTYEPRSTTVHTPLREAFENRRGVCQDFAHVQLGCLRSMGLAARYVSGYLRTLPPAGKPRLVGADASHAWLSVYCGEAGWIDVDPTNNVLVCSNYITVAWGRDYTDVCPIQGVIIGGGEHRMHVSVDVVAEDSPAVPRN